MIEKRARDLAFDRARARAVTMTVRRSSLRAPSLSH